MQLLLRLYFLSGVKRVPGRDIRPNIIRQDDRWTNTLKTSLKVQSTVDLDDMN